MRSIHRHGAPTTRSVAAAAAAAAVAVAVLGGCSAGGLTSPADDLASRSEDVPASAFGYTVGSPPDGYELCAVSVPTALSLRPDESASLRVYADAAADDPYDGPLYGVAVFDSQPLDDLPLGDTTAVTVDGLDARLGTIDGLQLATLPAGAGRLLTWVLPDGRAIQLAVRNDDGADLVAIAEGVEVDGTVAAIDPAVLPVEPVDLGDLYLLEGRPQFRFSVDYQDRADDGDLSDQLTILGVEGDMASLEAFRFRAAESRRVDVEDGVGVVADIGVDGDGPWVLSWMPEEDLILRMFSFRLDPDELLALERSVTKVGNEAWTGLVEELDPGVCEQ